jgi:hypothetical protein
MPWSACRDLSGQGTGHGGAMPLQLPRLCPATEAVTGILCGTAEVARGALGRSLGELLSSGGVVLPSRSVARRALLPPAAPDSTAPLGAVVVTAARWEIPDGCQSTAHHGRQ